MLNKTIHHLLSIQKREQRTGVDEEEATARTRPKYIVGIIAHAVKDILLKNDDVVDSIFRHNDMTSVNVYPLYFVPDVQVHNHLPLSLRNKLYNIDSNDIVEAFCNGKLRKMSF